MEDLKREEQEKASEKRRILEERVGPPLDLEGEDESKSQCRHAKRTAWNHS